ncbi:MAG: substrate-binding domain-containing protein [Spirochaetales bacterium]|nr:substrate-binding domain-containing protein [Spirochaetales bacterium]
MNKAKCPLTVGVYSDTTIYDIPIMFFRGIKEIINEHGLNLLYAAGKPIRSPVDYEFQANILFDLFGSENIDGLIILSNILSSFVPASELTDLCRNYHPLPIISAGLLIGGTPSVIIDNESGMYDAVSHLIEVHGHEKIAFLRGPEGHPDSEARYRAYLRALADHGLKADPELLVTGDFHDEAGNRAISILINERNKKPGCDVTALVAANDYMATGVIKELQNRGYRLPQEFAVVGFDDVISGLFLNPPLSTVRQSFYEIGKRSAELIIALLDGEEISPVTKIETTFIRRRSCGCDVESESVFHEYPPRLPPEVENALYSDPAKFLDHLSTLIYDVGLPRNYLNIWNRALTFLRRPEDWMRETDNRERETEGGGLDNWSVMARTAYNVFQDADYSRLQVNTAVGITSTLDIPRLMDILEKQLPFFGIKECYLVLYEHPPKRGDPLKMPGFSRLFMAIGKNGREKIPPEGILFPTRRIVPDNLHKKHGTFRLVIEDIYFENEQIGYWLLDTSSNDEKVYYILTRLISSSLQGALILKRYEERTLQLASANIEIRNLNEQLKDENLRIRTEMEVARHIQMALLPEKIKSIHPDFQIAARMITAEEVGGDYYDVSLDHNGTLWLGIGDVSGHGVTAGLIMMMTQTIHTTITANYDVSAGDIVVMVNNVLYKNVSGRMDESLFMTFTSLKYLGKGHFQYAGSHLDILVYRKATKNIEQIETAGSWLNIKADIREKTQNAEMDLRIGDTLILFTDGLIEVFDSKQTLLDMEGFIKIVHSHAEKDVEEMQDAIFADIEAWCEGKPKDDMSLVIARRVR